MTRAIILPVKAQYLKDILDGRKIYEVRKCRIDCPLDVYLYCPKSGRSELYKTEQGYILTDFGIGDAYKVKTKLNGTICAKFTLRRTEEFYDSRTKLFKLGFDIRPTCLAYEEIEEYCGSKNGHAWPIEDLERFDKPLTLNDFVRPNSSKNKHLDKYLPVRKAPQNYVFVERK